MPYPLELLGLLAAPPGAVTLVPSIAVSEDYVDNIFLSNRGKQYDFITTFTPGISLFMNRPRYRLIAGVLTSAEVYAKESSLNNAFGRQGLVLAGDYSATQQLTLRLSEGFALDRNTSATQSFSTGRQLSLNNTLTPGLRWQMTPGTSLDVYATYGVRRFLEAGSGIDSDTYIFQSDLDYAFTSRFTGSIGYGLTYLRVGGAEDSITHSPTLGFGYQLTSSLTVNVTGGPAITLIGGETFISPAGRVSVTQRLRNGSVNVLYGRSVAVAGGFGGTTDNQTAVATLLLPATWNRDLVLLLTTSYNTAKSVDSRQGNQVDVTAYRVNLGVAYRISRFVTAFAGYEFVHQRTGRSSANPGDADQNLVRVGLQFGYPFSLD